MLGPIPPTQLSGGVKTLILMAHDRSNVYNASTCGDNCAKWILAIADLYAKRRRKLLVNLYHLMDFGEGSFKIRMLGTMGDALGVATDMVELLRLAGDYVRGPCMRGSYEVRIRNKQKVFVVADWAAFGSEASRVLALQAQHPQDIRLCLPESFEWLLMSSGVLRDDSMAEVLKDPAAHIDSSEYASWERFFTDLLKETTVGTPFEYHKSRLAEA